MKVELGIEYDLRGSDGVLYNSYDSLEDALKEYGAVKENLSGCYIERVVTERIYG